MVKRCTVPTCKHFDRYGGRGISVCDRWRVFDNFFADMGERPAGCSIDRIDNDGDYCPENCRWATQREQMGNTCKTRTITFNGKTMSAAEWSRQTGIDGRLIRHRIDGLGWSVERALTEPPFRGKNHLFCNRID